MWNVLSGNRLIDRRRKEEAHRKHLQALNAIKPMIDNRSPHQYSFLYTRPKAWQLKIQRQSDIQSQNTILVQRMMHSSSYVRPKRDTLLKDSLNSVYRSRLQRQIDDGNQKLVNRLQSAKSQYSNMAKNMKQYSKYKSNMAFSRMDPFYDLDSRTAPVPANPVRPASAKR